MIRSKPGLVRPVLVPLAVCVLGLLMPSPAQAQDQAFKDAMGSREDKKWQEVVILMRRAIQSSSQESTRKVEYGGKLGFGRKSTDYLPYFYLGEALFLLQDCAGAMDAWASSEKQGVVKGHPEDLTIIQNGYIVCDAKGVLPPSKFDPLLARTAQHYGEVATLAGSVSMLGQQNQDQWRSEMREQYEKATAELENARGRISSGQKSRSAKDFTDATSAVDRARSILITMQASLRTAIDLAQSVQGLARDVDQTLTAADLMDRQIDSRKPSSLSQSLAVIRQQGRDALARARERYTGGVKSLNAPALTEARTLGQDATARFRQVLDEIGKLEKDSLGRQLSDALAAAQQASLSLEGLFGALDKRLAANPALGTQVTAERDAIRREADAARRRLESATRTENVSGIAQAAQLTAEARDRLSLLISKFGPITLRERGVSEALEEGVRQFFAGRYQQTLAALNPSAGSAQDALMLHMHLFRAAALHTLFLRSRETEEALRTQALAEIDACKKIDSMFQPDPRVFSPRFISFFQNGSAGGARSAATASQQ
jgi:hypothetical protein